MVSVGPTGEVRRLPWPRNQYFLFFFSSAACPRLVATFLSVDFLVFRSHLSSSRRCLSTMLPASFDSKPSSSPASGMEGLRRNITSIGSNPSPPEVGYSLRRASVLAQLMGEGLSLTFSGQASGKGSVCFSCLLIVANVRGLGGVWRGYTATARPGVLGGNYRNRERDINRD